MNPDRRERLAAALVLTYLLVRVVFFAVEVAPGVPPDEETHVGIATLYSDTLLFVGDSPASYALGLVTRVPYLYHMLIGKALTLNVGGMEPYLFLRLLNVVLALAGAVTAYVLAREMTSSRAVRLLALVLVTNTLMLTFLGGAVSYDNLVNLLSVAAVVLLVRAVRQGGSLRILAVLAVLGLGGLTKLSFLPVALLVGMLLVWGRRRRIRQDAATFAADLGRGHTGVVALSGTVALLLLANIALYGVNVVRYHRLVPTCDQVLELDHCMQNRIFARNWIVTAYRDGELTHPEAIQATARIRHPGDRDHAVRLIENERRYQATRPEVLNRYDYAKMVWNQAMKPTAFGIQAHRSMLKTPNQLLPYSLILLWGAISVIRGLRPGQSDAAWWYLAILSVGYFLILVAWFNYGGYVRSHAPFLGVQGRYLFPVLACSWLLIAEFILRPLQERWKWVAAAGIAAVFVWGDLPYFLSHANDAWFRIAG